MICFLRWVSFKLITRILHSTRKDGHWPSFNISGLWLDMLEEFCGCSIEGLVTTAW
jgi:hypothetical protein